MSEYNNFVKQKLNERAWRAAAFSWLLPGAGQFYLGKPLMGVAFIAIFLGLHLCLVVALGSEFFIWLHVLYNFAAPMVAVLCVLKFKPVPESTNGEAEGCNRNPWCAVFLSLLWPGIGHFYLRRWGTGIFFFLASIAGYYAITAFDLSQIGQYATTGYRLLVCLHAYIYCCAYTGTHCRQIGLVLIVLPGMLFLRYHGVPLVTHKYLVLSIATQGNSMVPTIYNGQSLPVSRVHYLFCNPKPGDIVLIRLTGKLGLWNKEVHINGAMDIVKRIVAVGRDTVQIKNDRLYVNGELHKDYMAEPAVADSADYFPWAHLKGEELYFLGAKINMDYMDPHGLDIAELPELLNQYVESQRNAMTEPYVVPEGHYVVLGDNIHRSMDSRDFGAIPRERIRGKVIYTKRDSE